MMGRIGALARHLARTLAVGALLALPAAALPALASPPVEPQTDHQPAWCPARKPGAYLAGRIGDQPGLAALRGKIDRREAITVLAIGSSSTEGSDLQDRRAAFPHQLAHRLSLALGEGRVRLVNRGRGGETIADTVRRFGQDVVAEKPDLVIWQLGANDIVRRLDPDAAARHVAAGMAELDPLGVPVVLMDSQLAPSVTASPTLQPTRAMLESAAAAHNALFWSRFDLMRDILATGKASERDLTKADNLHMTEAMHACTGTVLADALLGAIAPAVASARR
jgi:lysophospholipase L1-like esterase